MVREHNERAHQAWLAARLTAYAPDKPGKFMKLDDLLLADHPKAVRRQSWQQQMALTSAW